MARIPTAELRKYLLSGQMANRGCLGKGHSHRYHISRQVSITRQYTTDSTTSFSPSSSAAPPTTAPIIPLRKQLKDAARSAKSSPTGHKSKRKPNTTNQTVPGWDLTVGIEIHAQLNTPLKLFSSASTPTATRAPEKSGGSSALLPNTQTTPFDLAVPGSQPVFQPRALVPAIRAALALGCAIQPESRFDRKHYFHWDQPAGYQITQYYRPFARGGGVHLFARDGVAREDAEGGVNVGIRQVQMEQDTGKTNTIIDGDGGGLKTHWVDFNRVGVPLIEIITEPEIHHPATAAAFVRKVQMLLHAVDACTSGMESGGLRADVNVSVRRTGEAGMGTRTEIKNLSSFRAVEDAIIAERDRQIAVLEAGGEVQGETRGWSLGSTETRRLRGKEGEVDYRYMPDPDLGPVVVDEAVVHYLRETMGTTPDEEVDELVAKYGLSTKDAMSLMGLDDGARVEYFYKVLDGLEERLGLGGEKGNEAEVVEAESKEKKQREMQHAFLAANWCLHELGKLTELSSDLQMTPEGECAIPSADLAAILAHLYKREITSKVAKELLWAVFRGDVSEGGVTEMIESEALWFQELSEGEYAALADEVVAGEGKVVAEFIKFKEGKTSSKNKGYPQGKLMFLVGQMMRAGPEQRMDPTSAERVMRKRMDEIYVPGAIAVKG